jgi:GT2 family glycosyltransferase
MSFVHFLTLLFLGLTAFTLLSVLRDLLKYDLRLHRIDAPGLDHGLVTVVVPMRNEQDNTERCLAAVRSQTYANLEVVAVDDGSTDGTADRLAELQRDWPSLRIVSLEGGPPSGWAGKTHAAHRGAQEARGEWLLFIDADVVLGDRTVATAVGTAQLNDWPVLSLNGHLVHRTLWDLTLLLPVAILTYLFHLEFPHTGLNGQFILMRRAVYEATDGFASIRGAVVEDAILASRLAECGYRPRVRVWPEAYRCRMYSSLAGMWEGLTRILAGYNRFRAAPLVGAALTCGTVLLPQFVLVGLLLAALRGRPIPGALALAAGSLVAAHLLSSLLVARAIGSPLAAVLLKPIADLNVTAVLLDSARRAAFGGVSWKGRSYVAAPLQDQRPLASAPTPVGPRPDPRLAVVIPLSAHGEAAAQRSDDELVRLGDYARRHPEIEVIGVGDQSTVKPTSTPANLRLVSTADVSFGEMQRAGVEASRAPLVACADTTAELSSTWTEAILTAFDDPEVHLVTGPVRYEGVSAMATAASIREWGHLTDPWTVYPSPENFAGRRELLLRILPTGALNRAEGGILLGILAAIEGAPFKIVQAAVARVPIEDRPVMRSMAVRLAAATSLTARAARWADRQPSLTRLGTRLMPLAVWSDTVLLTLRTLGTWLDRFEVSPIRRPVVVLWLNLLATLDFALALKLVGGPSRVSLRKKFKL